MADYLDYLEDSPDVVASKDKLSRIIVIAIYLGIWAIALMVFWFFTRGSDAMGYVFVFLWVVLPATTFALSLVIGKNDYWGRAKWVSPVVFGVMYMLAGYATLSAANMAAFNKVTMPEFAMIPVGAIISVVGLGIGVVSHHMKLKSKTKK
ncbi:hypothetical protein [Gordonibacter sp.]|uniref:hypothetical protein n=2 Tax=Gordonibacter sp. TaxID=1968902 RepID=UPI002FC9FE1C